MAKKRAKATEAKSKNNHASVHLLHSLGNGRNGKNGWANAFSEMACATAHWAGKPLTFLAAVTAVVIWAASGPVFGFSDTWQLVINTSTTIITFLMVFLIQHTQNRDTLALQLKLAELIIAVKGAENEIATAEDLTEEELEHLHGEYRRRAEATLENLKRRRSEGLKSAS
jgi:low affinity Fe/Cu permease